MKSVVLVLLVLLVLLPAASSSASAHAVTIPSPTHAQTFAYGSERLRQWLTRGPDRHLALAMQFTNDPYVDIDNPRQYDDFVFDFPGIRLGANGRTFYYHPAHGSDVAVAECHRGFLGLEEVRLLENATLLMRSPHGYLSYELLINDRPVVATAAP